MDFNDRINGDQLRAGIKHVANRFPGYSPAEFCHETGTQIRRFRAWEHDEDNIPRWVPIYLAMRAEPEAGRIASASSRHLMETARQRRQADFEAITPQA